MNKIRHIFFNILLLTATYHSYGMEQNNEINKQSESAKRVINKEFDSHMEQLSLLKDKQELDEYDWIGAYHALSTAKLIYPERYEHHKNDKSIQHIKDSYKKIKKEKSPAYTKIKHYGLVPEELSDSEQEENDYPHFKKAADRARDIGESYLPEFQKTSEDLSKKLQKKTDEILKLTAAMNALKKEKDTIHADIDKNHKSEEIVKERKKELEATLEQKISSKKSEVEQITSDLTETQNKYQFKRKTFETDSLTGSSLGKEILDLEQKIKDLNKKQSSATEELKEMKLKLERTKDNTSRIRQKMATSVSSTSQSFLTGWFTNSPESE